MQVINRMLLIATLLLFIGCSNKVEPIALKDTFPKNIEQANRLVIKDGSTGEQREITDQVMIDSWIKQVREVVLEPLDDQGKRDGFLYSVILYEDQKSLFSFSLNQIDGVYFRLDETILTATEDIFRGGKADEE